MKRLISRTWILVVMAMAPLLAAEPPLALWRYGTGTLDGVRVTRDAPVLGGQLVVANNNPVRLVLPDDPDSYFIFSPKSKSKLVGRDNGNGTRSLLVEVLEGIVQSDIKGRGPWSDIHILGATADVQVVGTLFIVERISGEKDFVALMRGKVDVSRRSDVADEVARRRREFDENNENANQAKVDGAQKNGTATTLEPVASAAVQSAPGVGGLGTETGTVDGRGADGSGSKSGDKKELRVKKGKGSAESNASISPRAAAGSPDHTGDKVTLNPGQRVVITPEGPGAPGPIVVLPRIGMTAEETTSSENAGLTDGKELKVDSVFEDLNPVQLDDIIHVITAPNVNDTVGSFTGSNLPQPPNTL